jgi:hypothetical protein
LENWFVLHGLHPSLTDEQRSGRESWDTLSLHAGRLLKDFCRSLRYTLYEEYICIYTLRSDAYLGATDRRFWEPTFVQKGVCCAALLHSATRLMIVVWRGAIILWLCNSWWPSLGLSQTARCLYIPDMFSWLTWLGSRLASLNCLHLIDMTIFLNHVTVRCPFIFKPGLSLVLISDHFFLKMKIIH